MHSAQSTVQSLELELEKTRIAAPFNGAVSQRYVRLGQYVNVGDKLFQVTGDFAYGGPLHAAGAGYFCLQARRQVTVSPHPISFRPLQPPSRT